MFALLFGVGLYIFLERLEKRVAAIRKCKSYMGSSINAKLTIPEKVQARSIRVDLEEANI